MRLILICALALMAAGTSYGQLGQSEEASTATYGKPLSARTPMGSKIRNVIYRTESYDITAGFKDGKAVYFVYKKQTGASWTDDEVKAVLSGHRLGHSDWGWMKDFGTGQSGPVIHSGGANHVNAPQSWHIFGHDDFSAQYHPAKSLLLIWDASAGVDAAAILQANE